MATPRRSRRLMEQPKRRSLRLAKGSLHGYKKFPDLDVATPRTVFRKVLQTQPVVSPLVPEMADSPKPVETVFQFPSRNAADSNLEISLTGPIPEETFHPVLHKHGKKKKVRLSEFERAVDKQLPSTTAKSFLDNTSLTRSLQVTLGTPVTPTPDGKRGLIRRPKSYKGINVMTFEGGMEQNLLQIKGSENHYVDLQASDLPNTTASTELFAQSQLSGQSRARVPVLPSQPASARKSLSQGAVLSSAADLKTPQWHTESETDAGMAWQDQKDILMPGTEYVDGTGVPAGEVGSPKEEQQESELAIEGGMVGGNPKKTLTPGTEHAGGMDAVPQQRTLSLGRKRQESLRGSHLVEPQESLPGDHLMEHQESLHGDHLTEVHSSPEEYLLSDISTPKSSTPVGAKLPVAPAGGLRACLQDKPTKRTVKSIVEHIIEELDRSITPCVVDQDAPGADLEEEPSPSKEATRISQKTKARTPRRSVSRQEAEQLEREAVDKGIQQSGGGSKPREVSHLESEADLVSDIEMEPEGKDMSEAEMDPEVEDMSEAEMDSEDNEPPVKTPVFVRAKAFQCSPLLSSPHTLKLTASKSASEQPPKKRAPKSKKACREKRQPGISSGWLKKMFSHYARMPVAKDAFQAVERCVSLYFKHLSDDLEAYTNHARRKTIESADLELLMRRQGLITDKMPLNVLIEHHLPLEYRKLLIPVASSGNKVTPR
uniref:centromere protein T n=1 Tax=Euleptes europaea TaxID=460621 RepID=UPI002540ABE0|nr:centromere protein T [Euleptes europaea]